MLIILEGPDCVGKSTLAEHIATNFMLSRQPYHLFRAGVPKPKIHPLDSYVKPLLRFDADDVVLCDRWHVGECVYPFVMNRPTRMTVGMFNWIELFLQSRGATTLVLGAPDTVLHSRYAQRGDDYVTVDQMIHAADVFRRIAPKLLTRTRLDVDIMLAATLREQSVRDLRKYVTWIGSPLPEVLLVGDVRACDGRDCKHKTKHHPAGPAFMPYDSTSGAFLFGALNPLPADVAVANACDVDDPYDLWVDLERPKIVALGVKAAAKLASYGLSFAAVPHPQYVRRFHHGARAEYGNLIRNVAGTERNELKWRPTKPSTGQTSTGVLSTA